MPSYEVAGGQLLDGPPVHSLGVELPFEPVKGRRQYGSRPRSRVAYAMLHPLAVHAPIVAWAARRGSPDAHPQTTYRRILCLVHPIGGLSYIVEAGKVPVGGGGFLRIIGGDSGTSGTSFS